MNEHIATTETPGYSSLADAWDAVPRDGPAVLVVDTVPFDRRGEIRGSWIDPTRPEPEVVRAVAAAVGVEAWENERWVVLDQVRIGSVMIPEDLSVQGLIRVVEALRGDAR
jgi:hypothetical protein